MKLTHPDLPGVVIDVDAKRARNRRDSGWVDLAQPAEDGPKAATVAAFGDETPTGAPNGGTDSQATDQE